MKKTHYSVRLFLLKFIKINILALICSSLIFSVLFAQTQAPYTSFPTDSLSWNIKGYNVFDSYSTGYTEFALVGKDTVFNGKEYSQVVDDQERFIVAIREENKKIYTYIPDFGEHLLYDFNLEVGDTIFYHIALGFSWKNASIHLFCSEIEHYYVVTEKGVTTLMDGSIRNTITLFGTSLWIEGLGTDGWMGLLSPLNVVAILDGTKFEFLCINNKKSVNAAGECVVYIHESEEDCPCSPIICQSVNNLTSEKMANNSILLTWEEPEGDLDVDGYRVFRNDTLITEELVTDISYLDENLLNAHYEYYVVACCTNGCVSDSSNHVVESIDVGVKAIAEIEGITLYPNPTTGELRVENGEWRVANVVFFNIYGQKCHSQHGSILNVSHLPAGVYLMKINTETGVITKKIVKL